MSKLVPAEVFPPGEFIKEEIDARGWNQNDLAEILGRAPRDVSEIINGKRAITPATAKVLADAFGTSAELWMNLESSYQLAKIKPANDTVARKAKLFEKMPLREMIRRHWIENSENIEVLEKRALDFFNINSIEDEPVFLSHAARKSTSYKEDASQYQTAWLFRAKELAETVSAKKFTEKTFKDGLDKLKNVFFNVEDIRLVPHILSESGIRFLVVEHLPTTKIDGVCFWLNKFSPVVALSLRFDRVDNFWFTLLHELCHVKNKDGLNGDVSIDIDLVGEHAQPFNEKPNVEKGADTFAIEFPMSKADIEDFIARTRPLYSRKKIQGFSARVGVHPGIVVGQLQHRKEISYAQHRSMLEKIRNIITSTALTDGWGNSPNLYIGQER